MDGELLEKNYMILSKSIVIIDNSKLSYAGKDINGKILRGTETSLILLAEEFAKKGYRVDFANNIESPKVHKYVRYLNYQRLDLSYRYDLAIVVSDANFFKYVNSKKKALFSVSNQSIEKFVRKKQIIPFLKYRPVVVTLCYYQYKKRSFLTSPFGKKIIPITSDPIFLKKNIDKNFLPKKKVIYNIRSNRNLDLLVKIWTNYIYPQDNKSKFFITPGLIKYSKVLKSKNIFIRKITSRSRMINDLKNYRALLYLGHKSDIFTLTAEEAIKLGIPVVTYGIGSLADRVVHGVSGFVCGNEKEFSYYTLKLLNDNCFYNRIRKKLLKNRKTNNWNSICDIWIKNFLL